MTKKTTLKPIKLEYRAVGSADSAAYTAVMGLLNDFAIAQDSPDETNIESEFYDSPFDILYTGKPIKLTFTLVNYALEDLPALFGGTYTAATYTSVLAVTDTAPTTAAIGDKYVGITSKKIYTATAANTWDAGATLTADTAYRSAADNKLYVYDGTTVAASDSIKYNEKYSGATSAYTTEWEWKITYQKGNKGMVLYRGKTAGTLKQENKGALGYSVTITSLVTGSNTDNASDDKMYDIIGE